MWWTKGVFEFLHPLLSSHVTPPLRLMNTRMTINASNKVLFG